MGKVVFFNNMKKKKNIPLTFVEELKQKIFNKFFNILKIFLHKITNLEKELFFFLMTVILKLIFYSTE